MTDLTPEYRMARRQSEAGAGPPKAPLSAAQPEPSWMSPRVSRALAQGTLQGMRQRLATQGGQQAREVPAIQRPAVQRPAARAGGNPVGTMLQQAWANREEGPAVPAAPAAATQQQAKADSRPAATDPAPDDPMGQFLQLVFNRQQGKGTGAAATRRALMQMRAGLAASQIPAWLESINELREQSDPERLAAMYGGAVEGLEDDYARSQGALELALNRNGMGDSTFAAAGQARLAADNNRARAGIRTDIAQTAMQRGDLLRQTLAQLISGNMSGAEQGANSIRQDRLQQQQLDLQRGSFLDTLAQLGVGAAQIARYT